MDQLDIGQSVQVRPATPLWLAGGRFGTVLATKRRAPETVLVRLSERVAAWVDSSELLGA